MENKKVRFSLITIIIFILVVVACAVIITINLSNGQEKTKNKYELVSIDGDENIEEIDGVKVNISEELENAKRTDELEISDFTIKYDGKNTEITYDVQNVTSDTVEEGSYELVFINSNQKEVGRIIESHSFLESYEIEEKVKIIPNIDISNVYDIKVEKIY